MWSRLVSRGDEAETSQERSEKPAMYFIVSIWSMSREVVLLQGIKLTKTHSFGALNLALGPDSLSCQTWFVVTDEPTSLQTFREYGERFQIEEELLDEKSNGFQLESSEICSATALSRLCFVLAVATLVLTVQGQQVVATGKRRWVDSHWQRGNSYLRIGWNWI